MTAPRYRTSLSLATADQATPEAAAIMQRTQEQLGFVPNMYRAMAQAPGLLETYADGYNRFRSAGGFSPVEQEVVFLAISRWNRCHYCVAAHSVVADLMSKVPTAVTDALRDGRPLPDGRLSALADFTTHLLETRGWPLAAAVETFVAAGYHEHHVLAIVHAIAVKTISNYTNHMFQTALDPMFAGRAWQPGAEPPA